ncbi:MAG TPA: hypothetical protein VG838_14710 [Opitutaceae bacterium]|nr:hypothetical protein [Opitutaceae bacterium]
MKTSEPRNIRSADIAVAVVTGIWLVGSRAMLGVPWGFHPEPTGDLVNVGIVDNPADTWFYLSCVQQYCHGALFAGILYTTEPHAALLWSFPLWLIGHLAAWTHLPVIGVYNAAGLSAAIAAMLLFRRAAAALRLSPAAINWASLALLLGSGSSWLWHLASKFGSAPRADGGDLFFLDLFPSTAFLVFPYHTAGLALLAGLWWTSTELENRCYAREPVRGWLAGTVGFALLLAFSRPYEPLAFLGAWTLKSLWHAGQWRRDPDAARAAFVVLAVLGLASAPGLWWTRWLSQQPGVWSSFAQGALALGLSRTAWLVTLAGGALLAGLGARLAWKNSPRAAVLPLAASLLMAVILLSWDPAPAKMAGGLILGPILLAGWGAVRVIAAFAARPRIVQVGVSALALSCLLGTGSLALNLRAFALRGPTFVDRQLIALAAALPWQPGSLPPVVLTDAATGAVLPGLAGARVWLGHWAFSRDYAFQAELLKRAGFDPAGHPPRGPEAAAALSSVLSSSPFDYALLDERSQQVRTELLDRGWTQLRSAGQWNLLRAPVAGQVKSAL